MRESKELLGGLTVCLYHGLEGLLTDMVCDGVDIHAVIRRRVKNVNGVYSLASSLFVAEHEIDPLVQIVGDIIRL